MEAKEVLARLQGVFDDIFEGHGTQVTEATTAADIGDWDSLTNIELIVAVEKSFNTRLAASDLGSLRNVGDLVRVLQTRTGN